MGGGRGARDGFGAYGIEGIVAVSVIPSSIVIRRHPHAVLALAPVRLICRLVPVCERAAAVVH